MESYHISDRKNGFTKQEIADIITAFDTKGLKKVLLVVPDYTRYHSNAGHIANLYYHHLTEKGIEVTLLEALGTHEKMTETQIREMYGDIPLEAFIPHDWRNDVV